MNISNNNSTERLFNESISRPFPKIDHEFYDDNKDYFWQKDIKRINSEKSIFSTKLAVKKKILSEINNKFVYDVNLSIILQSNIFDEPIKSTKKMNINKTKSVAVYLNQPLKKTYK